MRSIKIGLAVLIAMLTGATAFAANQTAVITALAKQNSISEELAKKQLDGVLTAIKSELVAGRDVTIPNFGRFYVSEQEARKGRNPKTGAEIQIPAKRYPKFTSADNFKLVMNPKSAVAPEAQASTQVAKQG